MTTRGQDRDNQEYDSKHNLIIMTQAMTTYVHIIIISCMGWPAAQTYTINGKLYIVPALV